MWRMRIEIKTSTNHIICPHKDTPASAQWTSLPLGGQLPSVGLARHRGRETRRDTSQQDSRPSRRSQKATLQPCVRQHCREASRLRLCRDEPRDLFPTSGVVLCYVRATAVGSQRGTRRPPLNGRLTTFFCSWVTRGQFVVKQDLTRGDSDIAVVTLTGRSGRGLWHRGARRAWWAGLGGRCPRKNGPHTVHYSGGGRQLPGRMKRPQPCCDTPRQDRVEAEPVNSG
ncbi:hypothetical protein DPEC_G00164030 [Dallia pectoralis]|uniref:Uncharacterized protein n=1 Tax=Dallia pectoralis TaxID=75939 RepID=A0ACC2GHD0_DALPE|nr:hypothetical protein DPEC_G00164030 [Dallia pectoralis]